VGTPGSKQASEAPSDGSPHCISIEPPLASENMRWHRGGVQGCVWLPSAAARGGPKQRWRADEKQRGCGGGGGGGGGRGGAAVPRAVMIVGWGLAGAAAGSSQTWAGEDSAAFLLLTRYPIDECDDRLRTSGCEKISSSWTAGGALSGRGETLREDHSDSDSLPSTNVR